VTTTPLTIEQRLARLEAVVFPSPWLTVRDGKFHLNGKPFRDLSVNLAGDAVNSSDTKLGEMLDRIAACGCKMIRTLHWAIAGRGVEYKPSMEQWRAGFPVLDRLILACKMRGMYVWITLHHRQRVDEQTAYDLGAFDMLYHSKPDGSNARWPMMPGEIDQTFLVMPKVEKYVTDYCVELATRYKDDPTVALMTIANEKCRVPGYYPEGERSRTDASKKSYRDAWFTRLDEYHATFGTTDKTMYKHELARFEAWNAVKVYRRMYAALRAAGVKCPIGSTNSLGNVRMNALPIIAAGDFTDFHTYGHIPDLPNPFDPTASRSIATISQALRLADKPLCCGEYANIHESQKLLYPGYLNAPFMVSEAGIDVSNLYCAWLGPIGQLIDIDNPPTPRPPGYEYNGFNVRGMEAVLKHDRDEFLKKPPRPETHRLLGETDLFGWRERLGVGQYKDHESPIIGTVDYGADGVVLPNGWGSQDIQ